MLAGADMLSVPKHIFERSTDYKSALAEVYGDYITTRKIIKSKP